MWRMAVVYRPSAISNSISPICELVDHASLTLILTLVALVKPARIVLAPAKAISNQLAKLLDSMTGEKNSSSIPPRFTTPACSSEETGVGASTT